MIQGSIAVIMASLTAVRAIFVAYKRGPESQSGLGSSRHKRPRPSVPIDDEIPLRLYSGPKQIENNGRHSANLSPRPSNPSREGDSI